MPASSNLIRDKLLAQVVKAARLSATREIEPKLDSIVNHDGVLDEVDRRLSLVLSEITNRMNVLRKELKSNQDQIEQRMEKKLDQLMAIIKSLPPTQVTVETPAMVKSFEYDPAGRPVKVIEKKVEKDQV